MAQLISFGDALSPARVIESTSTETVTGWTALPDEIVTPGLIRRRGIDYGPAIVPPPFAAGSGSLVRIRAAGG